MKRLWVFSLVAVVLILILILSAGTVWSQGASYGIGMKFGWSYNSMTGVDSTPALYRL